MKLLEGVVVVLKTLSLATIGLAFALSSASACEWMEEKKQSVKAPSQPDIIASVLKPGEKASPKK